MTQTIEATDHQGRSRARSWWYAIALIMAVVALATLPATAASAETSDPDSSPAADSTITTMVDEVTISFIESLDIGSASESYVEVVGPDAAFYNEGCATVSGNTASTAVALGSSGTYTVQWQVILGGGIESGRFTFDYLQPAGTDSATGTSTSPCAPEQDADTADQQGPSQSEVSQIQTQLFVAGGFIVFLLAVPAVMLAAIGRHARRRDTEG